MVSQLIKKPDSLLAIVTYRESCKSINKTTNRCEYLHCAEDPVPWDYFRVESRVESKLTVPTPPCAKPCTSSLQVQL